MPLKGDPQWEEFIAFREACAQSNGFVLVGAREGDPVRPLNNNEINRAANGRYYDEALEVPQFDQRDNDRKPTYGTCKGCMRAGPVGQFCQNCDDGHGFWVFRAQQFGMQNFGRILDAENLARICETAVQPATTDLKIRWSRTPLKPEDNRGFMIYIDDHFKGAERDAKIDQISQLWMDAA